MVVLKVKASSLTELIVATVIICISMSSISIIFLHFYKSTEPQEINQRKCKFGQLEKQILNEHLFPERLDIYQKADLEITYEYILNSDSLLRVELRHIDRFNNPIIKSFIYVKN